MDAWSQRKALADPASSCLRSSTPSMSWRKSCHRKRRTTLPGLSLLDYYKWAMPKPELNATISVKHDTKSAKQRHGLNQDRIQIIGYYMVLHALFWLLWWQLHQPPPRPNLALVQCTHRSWFEDSLSMLQFNVYCFAGTFAEGYLK